VRLLAVIALAVASVGGGCRGRGSHKAGAGSAGSGIAGSGSAVVASSHVELKVDGGAARVIEIEGPTSLATLVPPTPPWLYVEATADDGRYLELSEPAKTYPGADVRLDLRADRVTVGVFRPPVTGVPADVAAIAAQPVVELTNVVTLEVFTRPLPAAVHQTLAVEIAGRPPHELELEELSAIPEQNDKRMRGWLVRDVLGLASRNARAASVKVIGDTERIVTAEELAGLALLKKNQRGELVFQMWEPGASRAKDQVRAVTRLVVEPSR
jgi:hypothetical protein